ncbi:MAG: 2-hydroxychromene-2-carboxylate isomerase [Candidatus Binatia bacterium]|nr:2-hydroxychromene-2-carboxylate isomerase [Candidatus Binatia bacterium]
MARLEFFFDCSSPWTYLAFHRVQEVIRDTGAGVEWRPILVGGVFNAVNRDLYEQRSRMATALGGDDTSGARRKAGYYMKDLADWARVAGLAIGQPPVFPVNSVRAMRGCFVAQEHGLLLPWARAVFETYWGDLQDISQPDVLRAIARRVGLDAEGLCDKVESQTYKDKLRVNTDEVIARGGFGSPTMFVNGDDMYFGNDRLELVRAALSEGGGSAT